VIITVTQESTDIEGRLKAGASMLNVACGSKTPEVVEKIRAEYPEIPLIASGGNSEESIARTIAAGANAITFTPPSTAELFKEMMEKYREE
jgi:CheY-like chemotaxis protein